MSEEIDLSDTVTVFYKDRSGAVKQLNVKITIDPSQRVLSLADIQLLAKAISKQLALDAA